MPGQLVAFVPFGLVAVTGALFAVSPSSLWTSAPGLPALAFGGRHHLARHRDRGGELVAGGIVWDAPPAPPSLAHDRDCLRVVDLALFASGSSYASSQPVPASVGSDPVLKLVKANLSPAGRYALVDPDLFSASQLVPGASPTWAS